MLHSRFEGMFYLVFQETLAFIEMSLRYWLARSITEILELQKKLKRIKQPQNDGF